MGVRGGGAADCMYELLALFPWWMWDWGLTFGAKITMEDLQAVEDVVRRDPRVVEQCVISGIAREDMHKVYCDGM